MCLASQALLPPSKSKILQSPSSEGGFFASDEIIITASHSERSEEALLVDISIKKELFDYVHNDVKLAWISSAAGLRSRLTK